MAIDNTKPGNVAANLMEQLESLYGEDAEIDSVMLIVSVSHGNGQNTIHYRSDNLPVHVGVGLLEQIKHNILNS